MSAGIGAVLVMLGSMGLAYGICREYRERLSLLQRIRSCYEYIQYEIAYGKTPLPQIMSRLADKRELCFREEFAQIASELWQTGEEFEVIWKRVFEEALKGSVLKKQEREFLLRFADKQGLAKEEAQARTLDMLLCELDRYMEQVQEEQKNRNKMVISMGMAGGMLLCILLL